MSAHRPSPIFVARSRRSSSHPIPASPIAKGPHAISRPRVENARAKPCLRATRSDEIGHCTSLEPHSSHQPTHHRLRHRSSTFLVTKPRPDIAISQNRLSSALWRRRRGEKRSCIAPKSFLRGRRLRVGGVSVPLNVRLIYWEGVGRQSGGTRGRIGVSERVESKVEDRGYHVDTEAKTKKENRSGNRKKFEQSKIVVK